MGSDTVLTATDIMATASEVLLQGHYQRISDAFVNERVLRNARFFEDPYGVVEIVVYETWNELVSGWADAQGVLVELISRYMISSEPKAWDGYLVICTPSILPSGAIEKATQIRNNTNRVRKLLSTGDELKSIDDVERVLLPLLPLFGETSASVTYGRALDLLPELLEKRGIEKEAVRSLVNAFLQQQSLMDCLQTNRSAE